MTDLSAIAMRSHSIVDNAGKIVESFSGKQLTGEEKKFLALFADGLEACADWAKTLAK